jgi:hypothetical protein
MFSSAGEMPASNRTMQSTAGRSGEMAEVKIMNDEMKAELVAASGG